MDIPQLCSLYYLCNLQCNSEFIGILGGGFILSAVLHNRHISCVYDFIRIYLDCTLLRTFLCIYANKAINIEDAQLSVQRNYEYKTLSFSYIEGYRGAIQVGIVPSCGKTI